MCRSTTQSQLTNSNNNNNSNAKHDGNKISFDDNDNKSSSLFSNKDRALHYFHTAAVTLGFLTLPLLINRGYTQWFFWLSVVQLFAGRRYRQLYLHRFLALMGTSICMGWYAALTYDYVRHGRMGHILYRNMPFSEHMMDGSNSGDHLTIVEGALGWKLLSHVLDTLGHPVLTYYYWSRCATYQEVLGDWNTIIPTLLLSRFWSWWHCYQNFGDVTKLWYFGYDVYVVTDLDGWLPAYLAEGTFYAAVVAHKLLSSSSSITKRAEAAKTKTV